MINIDFIAAQQANTLTSSITQAKELEKTATDALGVLACEGIGTMAIYLLSLKKNGNIATAIFETLCKTLNTIDNQHKEIDVIRNRENTQNSIAFRNFCGDWMKDPSSLFLATDAAEMFLTYVRYNAKAKQKQEKSHEPTMETV